MNLILYPLLKDLKDSSAGVKVQDTYWLGFKPGIAENANANSNFRWGWLGDFTSPIGCFYFEIGFYFRKELNRGKDYESVLMLSNKFTKLLHGVGSEP